MELGIIHRAYTRTPPPAPAAGAAQTIPCGEQLADRPADAIPGAITHDNQTEGYYIVSGGGTAFIDGHVVNGRHSTANPDAPPNRPRSPGFPAAPPKPHSKSASLLTLPPRLIHY